MRVTSGPLAAQESLTKQYYCVDLLKFICSLLVVAMHVEPLSSYHFLINYGICQYIAKLAVPFYFICSGFFLFRKTNRENFDKSVPLHYAARIFRLYVIWTIIYFPLSIRVILRDQKGVMHGILGWIRDCIFTGSYVQLWYLNATIVATLMLTFLLCRKVKLSKIMLLAAGLFFIGLLGQSYFVLLKPLRRFPAVWSTLKLIQSVIGTTRDGLFFGFPFMGIGMICAYKPINIPFKRAVIGFSVSMVLFFLEELKVQSSGWDKGSDMYIFLVPAAFFLFYLATHIELKPNKGYKYLRNLSILIFCSHLFVYRFVKSGYSLLGEFLQVNMNNSLLIYASVVSVTIAASHIIIKLSGTKQFAWLKALYS